MRTGCILPGDRGEYALVHLQIIVNNVCHRLGISCRTRTTTVDTIVDMCQLVRYTIGLEIAKCVCQLRVWVIDEMRRTM